MNNDHQQDNTLGHSEKEKSAFSCRSWAMVGSLISWSAISNMGNAKRGPSTSPNNAKKETIIIPQFWTNWDLIGFLNSEKQSFISMQCVPSSKSD